MGTPKSGRMQVVAAGLWLTLALLHPHTALAYLGYDTTETPLWPSVNGLTPQCWLDGGPSRRPGDLLACPQRGMANLTIFNDTSCSQTIINTTVFKEGCTALDLSAAHLDLVAECASRDPAGICTSIDDTIGYVAVLCSETFEGVAGFATQAQCNNFFDMLAHGIHSDPSKFNSLFTCTSSQRTATLMGPRLQPVVLSAQEARHFPSFSWTAAHPFYESAMGTCGICSGHPLSATVQCG